MSKAKKIIDRAASYIGVKRAGIELTPDEYEGAIDTLNDLLAELQIKNIRFQAIEITDPEDELGEAAWVRSYLKTELAMRLAYEFTVPVPPELMQTAKTARRRMLSKVHDLSDVILPEILPIGSGNQDIPYLNRNFYYSDHKIRLKTTTGQDIEDERGNDIVVENKSLKEG